MAILKIKDGNGNIIEVPALKGDKGDKGDRGDTPQKGVDYWTAADKDDIKSYVNQQISNKVTKIHCSYEDNVSTISADMGTILYKGDGVLDSVYVYSGLISANINTGANDYIWYKLVTEDVMKDYVNQQLGVIENGAY